MERPVFVMITLNSQKAIGPRYVVAHVKPPVLKHT
jgi:hypothetical protein